jgi:hypothetical protein
MYPIERAMKVFKGYVRNRPKASMAEGYILDETIGFVTEYPTAAIWKSIHKKI